MVLSRLFFPGFRFNWLVSIITAFSALIFVIFWQPRIPITFIALTQQPSSSLSFSPNWLVDNYSWPYAVSLTTLALAVISSAVVRKSSNSINWAGILIVSALGLLAVSANNPLTLVAVWVAIDLSELVILLMVTKAEDSGKAVIQFSVRMASVFLVLWSSIINNSTGSPTGLREFPAHAGILLLLAAGLRLGIIPLQMRVSELDNRRSIITVLRLVTAASGLALITRIPINSFPSTVLPSLIVLTGSVSLISGWIWLISKDELSGRPFWILSVGSLAGSAFLFGNSIGSVAWGASLILCGGFIFLYSGRDKSNFWLPALCLWSLTTLPYSLTASVWFSQPVGGFSILMVPQIFTQGLLIAGFFRYAFLQRGEVEIRSEPRWIQIIYPIGLSIIPIVSILISLWGWSGARIISTWWITALAIGIAIILILFWSRLQKTTNRVQSQYSIGRMSRISELSWSGYRQLRQTINQISSILEGDGGVLWSIVILVLFISLISQISK